MTPRFWTLHSLLLCVCMCALAQRGNSKDVLLGIGLTGTSYYGDINYNAKGLLHSNYLSFSPGIDVRFQAAVKKRFLPTINFGYGKFVVQNDELPAEIVRISPDAIDTIQVNKYAESGLVYGNAALQMNFNLDEDARFEPYASIGIGGISFFPRYLDGISLVKKQSFRLPSERSYNAFSYSLPTSLGMNVKLGERIGLNVAYIFTYLGTDYIDNIKGLGKQKGNDRLSTLRFGAHFRLRPTPMQLPMIEPFLFPDEDTVISYAEPLTMEQQMLPTIQALPELKETNDVLNRLTNIPLAFVLGDTTKLPKVAKGSVCDTTVEAYGQRIVELRTERNILKTQYKDLSDDATTLTRLADSLRNQLYAKQAAIVELMAQNPQKSKSKIDSLQNELMKLRVALNEARSQQVDLSLRVDSLRAELAVQQQDAGHLRMELDRLQTAKKVDKGMKSIVNDYKIEIAQLRKENLRLQRQANQDVANMLNNSTSSGVSMDQLAVLQARIRNLQRENNRLDSVERELVLLKETPQVAPATAGDATQIAVLKAENDQITAELEKVLDAKRLQDTQAQRMKDELSEVRRENEQYQQLLEEAEKKPAAPNNTAQIADMQGQINRLTSERDNYAEQLRNQSQNGQLAATQRELDQVIQDLNQLRRENATLKQQTANNPYAAQNGQLEAENRRLKTEIDILNKQVTTLSQNSTAGNSATLAADLTSARNEVQRLQAELAATKREAETVRTTNRNAYVALEEKANALTTQNQQLRVDAENNRQEIAGRLDRATRDLQQARDEKANVTAAYENRIKGLQDELTRAGGTAVANANNQALTTENQRLKNDLAQAQSTIAQQNVQLRDATASQKGEVERLRAENERVNKDVAAKEAEIQQVRRQMDELRTSQVSQANGDLQRENNEIKSRVERVELQLAQAEAKIAASSGESNAEMEQRILSLKQQINQLQGVLRNPSQRIPTALADANQRLGEQLAARDMEVAQLKTLSDPTLLNTIREEAARQKTEIAQLKGDKTKLEASSNDLKLEIKRLQDDKGLLNTQLANSKMELARVQDAQITSKTSLEASLVAERETKNRLQAEADGYKREITSLQGQLGTAAARATAENKDQIAALANEKTRLSDQVFALQKRQSELEVENNRLKSDAVSASGTAGQQVASLQNQLADERAHSADLTAQLTRKTQIAAEEIEGIRRVQQGAEAQAGDLMRKNTELNNQLVAARAEAAKAATVEVLKTELTAEKARVANAERERNDLQAQLLAAKSAASTSNPADIAQISALESRIRDLQAKLAAATAVTPVANNPVDVAKIADLESKNRDLQAKLAAATAVTPVANNPVDVAKIADLESKNRDLQAQLTAAKSAPTGSSPADKSRIAELEAQNRDLQTQVGGFKTQFTALATERDAIMKEVAILKAKPAADPAAESRYKDLLAQFDQLFLEKERYKKENEALKKNASPSTVTSPNEAKDLATLRTENEALRKQADDLRRVASGNDSKLLQDQYAKLQDSYNKLQKTYDALLAANASSNTAVLQAQIDKQAKLLEDDKAQISRLYNDNVELRKKSDQVAVAPTDNEQVAQLRTENMAVNKRLAEEQARNKQLFDELSALRQTANNANTQAQMDVLRRQKEDADRKLVEAEMQKNDLIAKVKRATEDAAANRDAAAKLPIAINERNSADARAADARAQVDRLQAENQELRRNAAPKTTTPAPTNIGGLEDKLARANADIQQIGAELAKERNANRQLYEDNQRLLFERNNPANASEMNTLRAQVAEQERKANDARRQADNAFGQIGELQKANQSLQTDVRTREAETMDLRNQFADLRRRYDVQAAAMRERETDLALAETQRTDFANRLAASSNEAQALQRKLQDCGSKPAVVAPALTGDKQVDALRQQQTELEGTIATKERKIAELETRLQQADAVQRDTQETQNQLAESEKTVKLLTQQLKAFGVEPPAVVVAREVKPAVEQSATTPATTPDAKPMPAPVSASMDEPSAQTIAEAQQILPNALVLATRIENAVVRDRIVRYFGGKGYTYQLSEGKILYKGVSIPEISKQVLDITFYMMKDSRGHRQLLAAIRQADGTYLSKEKFPLETYYARRLMAQMAQ